MSRKKEMTVRWNTQRGGGEIPRRRFSPPGRASELQAEVSQDLSGGYLRVKHSKLLGKMTQLDQMLWGGPARALILVWENGLYLEPR